MINLPDYFARIAYTRTINLSHETFFAIHRAHAFSIPFENLALFDTSLDRDQPIKLDAQSLANKLIYQKRGGYCYETNGLLALVLEQLGFSVTRLVGRVEEMIDHQLLLVALDDNLYLADVGLGGNGLIEPLPFIVDVSVKQFAETFKLIMLDDDYVLQVLIKDAWNNLYSFRLNPYLPIDYEPLNHYIAKFHPFLTHNRVCTLPIPEGRIILNNNELKIRRFGQNQVTDIPETTYLATLKECFKIDLPMTTQFKDHVIK
ncbi:MAG: arylamine N-acetyltransferase [Burkholderiales bacterium]|nr:arylamine N-acetyltransferase [Burkholderiales bacterium]